jgi:hypothetical protein
MTIGRKCLATTVITSALTLAVAVSGYWGVQSTVGRSEQVLQADARLAENAALARISVLNLRRYEKDCSSTAWTGRQRRTTGTSSCASKAAWRTVSAGSTS